MAPPPNDLFENAEVITIPSIVTGTTLDATFTPTEPAGGNYLQPSVWYKLVVTESCYLRVESSGDGWGVYGELYAPAVDGETPVSDDDLVFVTWYESEPDGAPKARLRAVAPGTYWLYVINWNFDDSSGDFTLNVTTRPFAITDLVNLESDFVPAPEAVEEPPFFFSDPYDVLVLRAGAYPPNSHDEVSWDLRRQSTIPSPLYDNFDDRFVIENPAGICPDGYPDGTFSNANGTPEDGEPDHAGFPAKRSVWFVWDPAFGPEYDLWVESTEDDYVLAVYPSTSSLEELEPAIAEDDNSGPSNQPFLTFTKPDANPVLIVVDSKGDGGDFVLRGKLHSDSPPANDDFDSRAALGGASGTLSGTLVGASYECGTPATLVPTLPFGTLEIQPIGGDIWYEFTPTGNDYRLTWASPQPVRVTVYSSSTPGTPTLGSLVLFDNFGANGYVDDDAGDISFGVTAGTTYYVRVEQADSEQDTVDFTWSTYSSPSGDDFGDAIVIPLPGTGGPLTYDYDLAGAGQQTGEPVDDPAKPMRSVWRKFTPAHDCTLFVDWLGLAGGSGVGDDDLIDVWRGTTIGQLDLVPGWLGGMNVGLGYGITFAVRLRKDEEYMIRHSNLKSAPPGPTRTVNMTVDYEADNEWTDADGWDSTTGVSDYTDGVLQFTEVGGYRSVNPWVGDFSSLYPSISFELELLAPTVSPTAADGPVLGRGNGPSSFYPSPGGRIQIMRIQLGSSSIPVDSYDTGYLYLSIVGDADGNSWLETWNGAGGGSSIQQLLWNQFAIPNGETEGGGKIFIEINYYGLWINGRLVTDQGSNYWTAIGHIGTVDWGPTTYWPNPNSKWGAYGPPETWTLQLQNMRMVDRVGLGPRVHEGANICEFETRIHHRGLPTNLYGGQPAFTSGIGSIDPNTLEAPNPDTNPNHQWTAVRVHNTCAYWTVEQRDHFQRHFGFWTYFDAFPNTGETVVVGCLSEWSGTVDSGYHYDVCRLEVNSLGELWIYPFRLWRDRDSAPPGMVEKGQKIGDMVLGESYWIEALVDFEFPWDTRIRVAVNEVECFPEYRGLVNQQDQAKVATARYNGAWSPFQFTRLAIGAPTGSPRSTSGTAGVYRQYLGHCDIYMGPFFVGRGGLTAYASRELGVGETVDDLDLTVSMASPGIGAHAGAVIPMTRDGVHKIPDPDTLDKFETTPAAMAAAHNGFFEYAGVRFYKGSTSEDVSINPDMSGGTTGYVPVNYEGAPAGDPSIVADTSGPPGFESEGALEVPHRDGNFAGLDHMFFGGGWEYLYIGVNPPDGVREGGNPDDDGGNHFLEFAWARLVGVGSVTFNALYNTGMLDNGAGPVWGFSDNDWHWIWGNSYPNYDFLENSNLAGMWRWEGLAGKVFRIKQVHVFKNAHTYPRFKTTTDNGATSTWVEHPDDPVVAFLNDDPNEATDLGVFMDNVCPFERFDRTGGHLPGLLGEPPTGISMGDYRHRRYVEVKPGTEAELEDMNLVPAALRVVVRGAGFGVSGSMGDVSTARTSGTLKVRMTHGARRTVVHDFPMTSVDKVTIGQVMPILPTGFAWQMDRISETAIRMGYHFNYDTKGLNDDFGRRIRQSGSAICKSLVYEVFAKTTPGPPICGVPGRFKSRLTKRI